MSGLEGIGKMLALLGLSLFGLGLILIYGGRIPFLGRLPGDITIQRDNLTIFFPLTTGLLLSIVLTILLYLLPRIFR